MTVEENKRLGKLLIEIVKNNKDALLEIYDIMKDILYVVGNTFYDNKEDLEDSIEELLESLLVKADKYKRNDNACAWIMKIYRNSFYNFNKHKIIEEDYFNKALQDFREHNLSNEDYLEKHLLLNYILENLDDYMRELYYFRYLYGLSIKQVAKEFGKSKSTIQYQVDKLDMILKKLFKS